MPYVFDAYGTLFDLNAAVARHRAAVGPDADRFSELWRQKQIEYTWNHTLTGNYLNFWTLTQRALDYCFERFPSVDRKLRQSLLDAYFKLDAYPDAQSVLRELKSRGERCAILTNGSPDMVGAAVEAAGLKGLLEIVLSVDAVKVFKTRPETTPWSRSTSPANPPMWCSSRPTAGMPSAPPRSASALSGSTGPRRRMNTPTIRRQRWFRA
jgi:2-haloacid dehalogenase